MEIAQDNMMYIRLCLAAATVGAMKRCAQFMYHYAKRRVIATGLLLDNPVTLVRLSEITAVIDAIDNFIYLVSHSYDENPSLVPEETFVVSKILGSEYLGWVADLAVQMLGARGYEDASDISKIFRDARVFRVFEGPTETLNMYIGSRGLGKNSRLENFISNTLNQKILFDDIKYNVGRVNERCLTDKNGSFFKPFSENYWAQALVGEVITYGLFLAGIQYSLQKNKSDSLQRAFLWVRSKYDEIIQKVMTFSLGEKVIAQADHLREFISCYASSIGNIENIKIEHTLSSESIISCEQHALSKKSFNSGGCDNKSLIFNEKEQDKLSRQGNNVEKEITYPDVCVYHLFEEQVIKTPKSVAVVYKDQKISYEELNVQANRVAYYLKKEGIEKDKLVAIYFQRSVEMIVGLLGVMKAQGAYLPLDYKYPEKNLKFMLEDSGAVLILSQKTLSDSFPFDAKKTIFIEDILENTIPVLEKNSTTTINTDSLGYVIYTSGSTGQPKGVMLPHKALTNLITWHNGKINGKRNVLQFTTLNFDMSFIEIFSALGSGGTLTLISEHDRLDLLCFCKTIKKHAIEQLIISVPFLKSLADAKIEKKYFASLKEIIIAGEQVIVTASMLSFFKQLTSCKLLNYYGPTETHVVTAYEFPQNTADWPDYPPIGQPIPNIKIILLDDDKEPVPNGFIGEIYIGGVCLAKGYRNREALTREKFIPDQWGGKSDGILYRSGDRGKFLPDGNLIFLGRKDEQLKIRGYRIEPQEIEWHLIKYPGIKEAVVIAKNNHYEDKQLEAFTVVDDKINDNFIKDIYSFLQARLPSHMHPSVFNIIESMPLTNSGKVDRKALEKYDACISYSINHSIEPTTHTEKEIIAIMEDVFKMRIGINNSFFSIGGNSLLAMQIISKLRDKFLVDIPAYSLLSDPTIADTAKRIDLLLFSVL